MKAKESNIEQVIQNVEQLITPCVKSAEVLSPTDLAAYLRAEEEGVELPPDVAEHLRHCVTCHENRTFIRKTDLILRGFRKKRVELMIRDVLAVEVEAAEEEKATEEWDASSANAGTTLPAVQKNDLADKIQSALSPANELVQEAQQAVSKVPSAAPLDVGGQISDICVKVGAISDPKQRKATTRGVCGVFRGSARRWEEQGILSPKIVDQVIDKLQSDEEWIDLSTLPVPLDVATAFVTSFPETCYFGDRHLLQKADNTIRFNWGLYQQLRRDAGAAISMSGSY
jgi:hypothetical protein